jgi:hypothetical protein
MIHNLDVRDTLSDCPRPYDATARFRRDMRLRTFVAVLHAACADVATRRVLPSFTLS